MGEEDLIRTREEVVVMALIKGFQAQTPKLMEEDLMGTT